MTCVFQKHQRLARGPQREFPVCRSVVRACAEARPGHHSGWIEHAEFETRRKSTNERNVNRRLRQNPLTDGIEDGSPFKPHAILRRHTADQVGARDERCGDPLFLPWTIPMMRADVLDGAAAVRHHVALELPGAAQFIGQQKRVRARRLAVHGVIRAHH